MCTFLEKTKEKAIRVVAERLGAVEFARMRLGFEPDEQQMEVLKSEAKQLILACSRQWGKSTTAAVKAVHLAYTEQRSLVLVASPSERQSAEFLRKAEIFVRRLGIRPKGDGDNPLSIEFPNGSRIVGLPGMEATVRGFSAVSMLIIDEAARVPDVVYKALRPVLALTSGSTWLMSTPCGKRGFFYEKWAYGGAGWQRWAVPATECSRLPADLLDREREELGAAWIAQEYMCEFVENGSGVFNRDVVEEAITDDLEPLFLAKTPRVRS